MDKFDITITIEHAGPTWIIEKEGVADVLVNSTIDHARFVAPRGSVITVKIVPAASAE